MANSLLLARAWRSRRGHNAWAPCHTLKGTLRRKTHRVKRTPECQTHIFLSKVVVAASRLNSLSDRKVGAWNFWSEEGDPKWKESRLREPGRRADSACRAGWRSSWLSSLCCSSVVARVVTNYPVRSAKRPVPLSVP